MINEETENTKPIRIAAIFTILVTSLMAGLLPLIFKVFQNPVSWPTRIVRSLGSGVILALALIHIIPDSIEMLGGLTSYDPLGGVVVLGGILLVIIPEHLVNLLVGDHDLMCQHGPSAAKAPRARDPNSARYNHIHDSAVDGDPELCCMPDTADPGSAVKRPGGVASIPIECCGGDAVITVKEAKDGSTSLTVVRAPAPAVLGSCQHNHSPTHESANGKALLSPTTASSPVLVKRCVDDHALIKDNCDEAAAAAVGSPLSKDHSHDSSPQNSAARLRILAFIFEFGCIFHSVIVGIDMGVNITDLKSARALLAALVFHQMLEGISLGTVIVQGSFYGWRGVFMVVAYSITCPIGIAIGMGIASTYNPDSLNANVVQGVFDGVSGGMLLYIALVQLLAEDMGRLERGPKSALPRIVSVLGMCLGAGGMAIIAIWA